ncbi:MAG: DUF465 domain-containing protein [Rickettsiaceae bacterium]|nr:DUF465 domain-containing protein [Rickettsiaceae bacterium]
MLSDEDINFYLAELKELEQEHKELNEVIDAPDALDKFSEFTLQKFKKRKLLVKDKIKLIKNILIPNRLA